MNLKGLLLPERTVSFEVAGCPGFEIELTYLSREEMQKLLKKCTTTKFDSRTRKPEETLNEETFSEEYAKRTIKGWKGFKYKHAKQFVLLQDTEDEEEDIEYNEDNAVFMLKQSSSFEKWVTDMTGDLENFTKSN